MNLPRSYALKPGQLADPVVWRGSVPVPPGGYLPADRVEAMLDAQFGPDSRKRKASRLQTWARADADPDGPHLIGVRNGTPMHVDPAYPRYTHQVVVWNAGWAVTGWARLVGPEIPAGAAFCLDTHSPHQLVPDPRVGTGSGYLAVSLDAAEPVPPESFVPRLLAFLNHLIA